MLKFIPAPIIGIIATILYCLNFVLWSTLLSLLVVLKYCMPTARLRDKLYYPLHKMAYLWIDGNKLITRLTTNIDWQIDNHANLSMQGWYIVVCNHQSWTDILVLDSVFNNKIPLLKFFMKKQLLWFPFGWVSYALDFPFMGRYTKDYLKKYPHMKGKDIEATKKACEKFKLHPTTVINFPEGTRFTPAKHDRQNSPFKNLLKPKAGGIAFTINSLSASIHQLINVTIVYPQGKSSMWDFFCGKIDKIKVHVELLPIPPDIVGDYENDPKFRQHFQKWLNNLWHAKDNLIDRESHG